MNFRSLLLSVMLFAFMGLSAQTLVSTESQLKNAVLEEYTGIYCGYCPDGHAIAADLLENNPGRAVVIAIHQGSFAAPNPGDPDYRTEWGDALASQGGISSYPSGTVNRHIFSGGATGMGRGDWTPSANQIMTEGSPVNLGVESSYEETTRELTIHVELYYTSDAAEASNFINIALIQSHVFGPQSSGGAGNNYEHMHMLREMITGQWGEEIFETTEGSFVERTYTYTVPEDYNDVPCVVEDCEIVAFVSETHQEILTGDAVHAIGGTNQFIGNVVVADEFDIQAGSAGAVTTLNLEAYSNLDDGEEFEFTLESVDVPADWDATFTVDGQTYTSTATVAFDNAETMAVTVEVTPGDSPKVAEYIMTISAVGVPEAPSKQVRFYVISGVTDLIVNGVGGPEAIDFQDTYIDGLEAICTSSSITNTDIFVKAVNADALAGVNNIYLNISWTFPALTIPQIGAVESFMDNGGNVLIAGQDIGWDFMSGADGSHPSAEATEFYEDYLFANYVDDGSSSNNQFIADDADEIYGATPQSSVVDVFGGNMYPEQLEARDGASEVFFYNSAMTKCGAVRATAATYKVIYFGIGLEMLGDEDVKDQILASTKAWFDGGALAPIADFSASAQTIYIHESVDFSDLSLNNPTSWSWEFESGDPATSADQNPTVTYDEVGIFNVTLSVTNEAGINETVKDEYITVNWGDAIDKLEDKHIAVYPNPVNNGELNFNSIVEVSQIDIFDQLGRKVHTVEVNQIEGNIDVNHLENGLYVVRLYTEKGVLNKNIEIR
ncbi:MAG: Omp28-related outer membrane protein [Bacteroidales bacterium]|nr:Omp28-related outer membrane protein [Bacteroidales bacterium]